VAKEVVVERLGLAEAVAWPVVVEPAACLNAESPTIAMTTMRARMMLAIREPAATSQWTVTTGTTARQRHVMLQTAALLRHLSPTEHRAPEEPVSPGRVS
jgi:hypothetical protein